MPGLTSGTESAFVTLRTADDVEIELISVAPSGEPVEFEGSLTPVDATEQFRPGGIPREWRDFSAGGGYSFDDDRVPNGFAWGKNIWTMVPNSAFPSGEVTEVTLPTPSSGSTLGVIRSGFESGGHLYLTAGAVGLKVANGSATAATEVANFVALSGNASYLCTSAVTYLGKAYWGGYDSVGQTAAKMMEHTIATDSFTASSDAFRWELTSFYGVDGGGTWDQWLMGTVASGAAFKVTNSASPLTDSNWTPGGTDGTAVGDQAFKINRIVAARQAPFFLKEEGVYAVQRNGVYIPNVTPHWLGQRYTYNGVTGQIIAGKLYAAILSGIDMVVGLDGQLNDTPYLVHPGAELPNETPAAGFSWAMCADGDRLVAAIYNAGEDTTYICWGKPRGATPGQPGLTTFIWHIAPMVLEGERVTWMMRTSPSGNPRLWVASVTLAGTVKLRWLSLPRYGNPLQDLASDGPWRCRTDTCTLYLSSYPGSQGVHALKALRQVASVTKGCSDTSYLTNYVSVDEATREQIGATVTESPYTEARILEDISGRQLAASIDFKAGSTTTPPILRAHTMWAGEGVRSTVTYQGRFRFTKGCIRRNGTVDNTSDPQATWELLIGSQGPRPASITDWKGTVYTVAFEQGATWGERYVRDSKTWEIDATIRFTVLAREGVYDDGSVYDSTGTYVAP